MIEDRKGIGHIIALLTIFIWGTTFISTKVLLHVFESIEILFIRFILGFIALCVMHPHRLKTKGIKEELYFVGAGLCGVTLYFLFENIALTYTLASNVGIIVAISPFFVVLLARVFLRNEKLRPQFFIGFIFAMLGIVLISLNGSAKLQLNPTGDVLAVLAAFVWAVYSILTKKISEFGYNIIQTTRRIFFYGILLMLPMLFLFRVHLDLSPLKNPMYLLNILYLGIGASAICFVSWGYALKILGVVKTSVYIYLVPVVTIVTAALILKEQLTLVSIFGAVFTILGLVISEYKKVGKS